ncbi:MAG: hypothetical protein KGJ36_03860, partial [Acidobacteriota bacterium]|nr:hypothetical protein [Acidobacteriota bacterium]
VDSTAYRPSDVGTLAAALDGRGGFHLQISSISAYRDPDAPGATEDTAVTWGDEGLDLDGAITNESYGPLKAASERAALASFSDGVALVRPTYVIGAFDATLRFPYWVERARRGGVIAVPGPRESAMQYVDARDLADFVVGVVATSTPGAFHVAGPFPATRFVDMVERVARHVAPAGTRVEVLDAGRVLASPAAGKFPLWSGGGSETALAVDPAKALAHGLALRPLEESVDDVVAWWKDRDWPSAWLSADEERGLLG